MRPRTWWPSSAEAWNTLTPRITNARRCPRAVTSARRSARRIRAPRPGRGGAIASQSLTRPRSHPTRSRSQPDQVDHLIDSLEAIRRELEESTKLRGALDVRLADARARLANLTTVIQEARTAHEELAVKIAVPTAPPPTGARATIRAPSLTRSSAWPAQAPGSEARQQLERWTSRTAALLEDAQRILRANRAPLEARNQFRGCSRPTGSRPARVARDRGSRARADLRPGSRRPVHGADRPGARGPARAPLSGDPGRGAAGPGGGAMNCTQPGCTGLIVDGYCDLCGMAPAATRRARPPRPGPTPSPPRRAHAPSGLTLTSVGTTARPATARTRTSVRGRLGAGLGRDPAGAVPRPGRRRSRRGRRRPGEPALLRALRRAGRTRPRRRARPHRGLLPQVRHAVLVRAQAARRRSRRPASTRWSAASPTAGWDGSTWPGTATSPTAGSC